MVTYSLQIFPKPTTSCHRSIKPTSLFYLLCSHFSVVVLEDRPWPRGSSRTKNHVLGLGLGLEGPVLGLCLGLAILSLTTTLLNGVLILWRPATSTMRRSIHAGADPSRYFRPSAELAEGSLF